MQTPSNVVGGSHGVDLRDWYVQPACGALNSVCASRLPVYRVPETVPRVRSTTDPTRTAWREQPI